MRRIEVVEYNPSWAEDFELEKKLLLETLGAVAIEIHHIGSTAVPGLAAKPIIDILIEVSSLSELDELNVEMKRIGYKVKGEFGIPGRRYFQKGGDDRTHQVHAFLSGDENVIRHIVFRDYLISYPAIADEYASLKRKIALECGNDIEKYCDGKNAFVKHHEAIAVKQKVPGKVLHRTPASGAGEI